MQVYTGNQCIVIKKAYCFCYYQFACCSFVCEKYTLVNSKYPSILHATYLLLRCIYMYVHSSSINYNMKVLYLQRCTYLSLPSGCVSGLTYHVSVGIGSMYSFCPTQPIHAPLLCMSCQNKSGQMPRKHATSYPPFTMCRLH